MPDAIGLDLNPAAERLRTAGLDVDVEPEDSPGTRVVSSTNPEPGTVVRQGTVVVLIL